MALLNMALPTLIGIFFILLAICVGTFYTNLEKLTKALLVTGLGFCFLQLLWFIVLTAITIFNN